jgi:hypothetical protein
MTTDTEMPIAVVWWGDAVSGTKWDPIDDAATEPMSVISSGFLHSKTHKGICLIQSVSAHAIRHDLFIPHGMIRKVKILRGRYSKP